MATNEKNVKQLEAYEEKTSELVDRLDTIKELIMKFMEAVPIGYIADRDYGCRLEEGTADGILQYLGVTGPERSALKTRRIQGFRATNGGKPSKKP